MRRASIGLLIALTFAGLGSLAMEYQKRTFEGILHEARVVFVGKPGQPFVTQEMHAGEQGGKKYRMRIRFYHYVVEEQIVGAKELALKKGQALKVRAPNTYRDIDVAQIEAAGGMEMPEYWEYVSPFSDQQGSVLPFDAKGARIVYLSGAPHEILGEDLATHRAAVVERFVAAGKADPGVEPGQPPPDMPPVQRPADPQAVHAQMDGMKAAADALIAQAKTDLAAKKGTAVELFVLTEGRIHLAMWPAFGPANAWLFNERTGKIRSLADALGLAGEEAPAFEAYARVILAAAGSKAELQPFVERDVGLDLRFQKHVDGRLTEEHRINPIRGESLQTIKELVQVRGWLEKAAGAGGKPHFDAEQKRVRVRRTEGSIDLIFGWHDRWVLTGIVVGS